MTSLQSRLLVAIPRLEDPNFSKSVVLLIDHDQSDGAFGVILNRPTRIPIRKLWQQLGTDPCLSNEVVYQGGPVDGVVLALHTNPDWAEHTVMEGLYVATQDKLLNELVNQESVPFRLYTGYSGWGPGQLENEIDQGGWLTLQAEPKHVFQSADELWKSAADSIAHRIILGGIDSNQIPLDPDVN